MSGGQIKFEMVRDSEGLLGLRNPWDALWARSANEHYELSHSVVWHAWDRVAEKQGHHLRTIVGQIEGRVVLIWPAILRREKFQGTWRVATWLGRDPIDFGAVLVERNGAASAWIAAAIKYLADEAGADVLSFACVPEGSVLYDELGRLCPGLLPEEAAPFIDLDAWDTWGEYEASLPKSFRKNLRRRLKRLEESGKVEFRFESECDVGNLEETIDWITRHKCKWLEERGMKQGLLTSAEYAESMVSTLGDAPAGKAWLTKLLVDGVTVAADINLVSGGRCYSDYGSFDLAWARFSPGALLMRETIRWAFNNSLEYLDLGRGADEYKLKWCSGITRQSRFLYPCNLRGSAYVRMRTSKVAGILARRRTAA